VVVGDEYTGKTALLLSYATNTFPEHYVPTIFENYSVGTEFHSKNLLISLWDTTGLSAYSKFRSLSFVETDAFLICFDVSNPNSLANVITWFSEVKLTVPEAKVVLVATKIDLRNQKGDVCTTKREGRAMASKIKADAYVECSSLTRQGVSDVFEKALGLTRKPTGLAFLKQSLQSAHDRRNSCSVM